MKIIKTKSKAAQASKSAKDKTKAAEAIKIAKESITTWLPGDIDALHAEARKAGTTGTNLARILIRDGLAELASGKYRITSPAMPVPFNLIDEDGKVFERGEMPPELYDRACRAAEDRGVTVTTLFESAITKAAEKSHGLTTTTVELDAALIAKGRACMAAIRRTSSLTTLEECVEEFLENIMDAKSGYFADMLEEEDERDRVAIEAELQRILLI